MSDDDSEREEGYRLLYGHLLRGARYLASRSPVGDHPYLVAECCQNALLKIHRRIADCRSADTFLGWCSTIVIREMHDLQRKDTRRETVSLDEPIGDDYSATRAETLSVGQEENTDIGLERQELWQYLMEGARHHFSDDSMQVILGGYLLGKNDRELAREINTSPGNITVIRFRDFQRLRDDPDFTKRFGNKPSV